MALTDKAVFSHCLPLRRNVKATDGVMDAPYCIAIEEAENRLHVQKAILAWCLDSSRADAPVTLRSAKGRRPERVGAK